MDTFGAKVQVAKVAGRQWGRVGSAQLASIGVDGSTVARWLKQGYLHRRLPRVYAVGHAGTTIQAELAEALLYAGPGAALSHATAAWWRGLIDQRPPQIHLSTPRRCRSLPAIAVHRGRTFDRIWHNGLPLTPLPQTFLDIAATQPRHVLRHVLANADYRRILNPTALEAALKRGRPGSAKLRAALAEHQPKLAYTRSHLERAFLALCETAHIPLPQMNVRIAGWTVDAVWNDLRLVIELDGYDNHRSPAQIKRDRRKELDLRAAGCTIVRYSSDQVFEQPAAVTGDLRRQRANAASAAAQRAGAA